MAAIIPVVQRPRPAAPVEAEAVELTARQVIIQKRQHGEHLHDEDGPRCRSWRRPDRAAVRPVGGV